MLDLAATMCLMVEKQQVSDILPTPLEFLWAYWGKGEIAGQFQYNVTSGQIKSTGCRGARVRGFLSIWWVKESFPEEATCKLRPKEFLALCNTFSMHFPMHCHIASS